jgi:dTDP-4-amino-4,6-dideoxygalactose transaminase
MTDIAASLGIHQLKKAWQLQQKRANIAQRYDEAFADLPLLLPPKANAGDTHSWHLYVIRLTEKAPINRDVFIKQMIEKGIGCSVHYIPLHLHPYWRDTYHLQPTDFPRTLSTYQGAVSLPIYTKMTETDQEWVIKAVREILT